MELATDIPYGLDFNNKHIITACQGIKVIMLGIILFIYGKEQKRLMFCICNNGVITVGTHKKYLITNRNKSIYVILCVNIIRLHSLRCIIT